MYWVLYNCERRFSPSDIVGWQRRCGIWRNLLILKDGIASWGSSSVIIP